MGVQADAPPFPIHTRGRGGRLAARGRSGERPSIFPFHRRSRNWRGGGLPRTVAKPLVQGLAAQGSPGGDPSSFVHSRTGKSQTPTGLPVGESVRWPGHGAQEEPDPHGLARG